LEKRGGGEKPLRTQRDDDFSSIVTELSAAGVLLRREKKKESTQLRDDWRRLSSALGPEGVGKGKKREKGKTHMDFNSGPLLPS